MTVVSGGCDGFIGNRMLDAYVRQACYLVEEGASPPQIDRAMEAFGFAMGPFRATRPGYRCSTLPDRLCATGRLGQKTGGGWYEGARILEASAGSRSSGRRGCSRTRSDDY